MGIRLQFSESMLNTIISLVMLMIKDLNNSPYFGSRAKRRLVKTSSITWNWRDVIVAVMLCELNESSFKGFTCDNSITHSHD